MLMKLLKENNYVLINKTTDNDRDTTTEIWHKDQKGTQMLEELLIPRMNIILVTALRNRRVSIHHRTQHRALYHDSYPFQSKGRLVYKDHCLQRKHLLQCLLSDRSISVIHIRARYTHSKPRAKSTFNRKLQFYKDRRTNRYRTKTSKHLTYLLSTKQYDKHHK